MEDRLHTFYGLAALFDRLALHYRGIKTPRYITEIDVIIIRHKQFIDLRFELAESV